MASFAKFNAFVEAVAHKKHDLSSDTISVALTNTAPLATNAVLTDLTEIVYTNLSARNFTRTSSAQTSGTYKLILQDLVLTASGAVGPFRYAAVYNNTATNKDLIGFYDYGSSISLAAGETLTIDCDQVNGLFTLA